MTTFHVFYPGVGKMLFDFQTNPNIRYKVRNIMHNKR